HGLVSQRLDDLGRHHFRAAKSVKKDDRRPEAAGDPEVPHDQIGSIAQELADRRQVGLHLRTDPDTRETLVGNGLGLRGHPFFDGPLHPTAVHGGAQEGRASSLEPGKKGTQPVGHGFASPPVVVAFLTAGSVRPMAAGYTNGGPDGGARRENRSPVACGPGPTASPARYLVPPTVWNDGNHYHHQNLPPCAG